VPTVNTWLGNGTTNSFWTAANWSESRVPNSSDEVVFDGDVSNQPCNNFGPSQEEMMGMGDGSYYRISLQDGYSGAVTLGTDLTVHNLELSTGALNLGQYVSAINVTETFDWSGGGALNDTEYAGGLFLWSGCVATIAPGEENTLTTGMTIQLLDAESISGGASLTFKEGELVYDNNTGLNIGMYCTVFANADGDKNIKKTKVSKSSGQYTINPGGTFNIMNGTVYSSDLPLENNAGTLEVIAAATESTFDTTANFSGAIGTGENAPTIKMISGHIIVSHYTNLNANGKIKLEGGILATKHIARSDNSNSFPPVIGTTELVVAGADISLYYNLINRKVGSTLMFDTLKIDGKVKWTSGNYDPFMQKEEAASLDQWISSEEFTIDPDATTPAKISPSVINGNGEVVTSQNGTTRWAVIQSLDEITLDLQDLPTVDSTWLTFDSAAYAASKASYKLKN
jgi:hypothetical protein